jgi:hypothetical protein
MALRKGKGKHDPGDAAAAGSPGPTAQEKALDLAEAFFEADRGGLERLDADGRAEQERLRTDFYMYVDALWDHAKARSRQESGDPDYDTARDPAYSAVAGMRDLAAELIAAVHDVQASAGDRTDS